MRQNRDHQEVFLMTAVWRRRPSSPLLALGIHPLGKARVQVLLRVVFIRAPRCLRQHPKPCQTGCTRCTNRSFPPGFRPHTSSETTMMTELVATIMRRIFGQPNPFRRMALGRSRCTIYGMTMHSRQTSRVKTQKPSSCPSTFDKVRRVRLAPGHRMAVLGMSHRCFRRES